MTSVRRATCGCRGRYGDSGHAAADPDEYSAAGEPIGDGVLGGIPVAVIAELSPVVGGTEAETLFVDGECRSVRELEQDAYEWAHGASEQRRSTRRGAVRCRPGQDRRHAPPVPGGWAACSRDAGFGLDPLRLRDRPSSAAWLEPDPDTPVVPRGLRVDGVGVGVHDGFANVQRYWHSPFNHPE